LIREEDKNMKKILIIALTVWVLSGTHTTKAASIDNTSYYDLPQSKSDRKAEREYRREQRKAKRAEYRAKHGKSDYVRTIKDNNKQRRKMDKASRKENRRRWDTNELGDVYGIN
jgi:uncharacterized protein YxeA